MKLHWERLNQNGATFDEFITDIEKLPKRALWRYGAAGDLPGRSDHVDPEQLNRLAQANKGKSGFAYTHKPPTEMNLKAIRKAVRDGFTINLSADSLEDADRLAETGLPTVTLLPSGHPVVSYTPAGRKVVVCPEETKGITCAKCAICAEPNRSYIVGFRAHGARKKTAEGVFYRNETV